MQHLAHQDMLVRARLHDSDAALLRLLAACHRRKWSVVELTARRARDSVCVEMALQAPRCSRERVAHGLGNLVDVLEVAISRTCECAACVA
jgi:hypothetical protein